MILVSDIWKELQRVLATCDESEVYSRLNEAVQILKNTGLWNPLIGRMDICTSGCEITLPDDVESPLAINLSGQPADFRNRWFEFHLNGPGSEGCCGTLSYSWTDRGEFPTFRDPIKPSFLVAYPEADEGPNFSIRVYGYDQNNKWVMTPNPVTGTLEDGCDVPVVWGIGMGTLSTVAFKRITRVSKPVSVNFIRLVALDPGSSTGGTLIGYYKPSEREPQYRRIKVSGIGCERLCSCSCTQSWVRMQFRRKVFVINSQMDLIPLNSSTAIKMACMAIRKYESDLLEEYAKYMNAAEDALRLEQRANNGPNQIKIQMQRLGYAAKPGDNMI